VFTTTNQLPSLLQAMPHGNTMPHGNILPRSPPKSCRALQAALASTAGDSVDDDTLWNDDSILVGRQAAEASEARARRSRYVNPNAALQMSMAHLG